MIDPGTFYVVTIGRRYLRFPDTSIVGGQLEHAARFKYRGEAVDEAVSLRTKARKAKSKHEVGVRLVTIESIPLPPEAASTP